MKSYEQQKCIANNYWLLARKADPMAASVLAAINGSNSIFSVVYEYTSTGVKGIYLALLHIESCQEFSDIPFHRSFSEDGHRWLLDSHPDKLHCKLDTNFAIIKPRREKQYYLARRTFLWFPSERRHEP